MTLPSPLPPAAQAADFKFSCPFCQQHLACEDSVRGTRIQCPSCRAEISVPAALGLAVHASTTGHGVHDYSPPLKPGQISSR